MHILIVEDEEALAGPLSEGLALHGFTTSWVRTGAEALESADTSDLLLVDLGLPDIDGMEVCRRVRAISDIPIIVLSGRDGVVERVLALELYADDFVAKPPTLRELIARIRAVQRRSGARPGEAPEEDPTTPDDEATLELGALTLDRRARRVTVGDRTVELTAKEFDLLAHLMDDPGAVAHRSDIMAKVWDSNWYGSTKTLDTHISTLRSKLGDPGWIETVRGVGFRIVELR